MNGVCGSHGAENWNEVCQQIVVNIFGLQREVFLWFLCVKLEPSGPDAVMKMFREGKLEVQMT